MHRILRHIPPFIMGLVILAITLIGFNSANQIYREYVPVSTVFEASVQVPNFKPGDNPPVIYTRTIKQDFIGSFRVDVKSVKTGATICSGSGTDITYSVNNVVDPANITFDWYIGAKCSDKVKFGEQYILDSRWTVDIENWPTKYLTKRSNIFQIE